MQLLSILRWLCEDTDRSIYDDEAPLMGPAARESLSRFITDEGQITQRGRDYLAHAELVAAKAGVSTGKAHAVKGGA